MEKLQGSFTALVTPMNQDGSVDYASFEKLVDFQIASGITGLLVLGTSGETPTLTEDEEDVLIEIAAKKCADAKKAGRPVTLILGAGSNCTLDSVHYMERAKRAEADYALVVTPYYNKPSDEGVYAHFAAASAVGVPIIVYNIAGRTGKNISCELLARIADLPNIAGVKEASGNITQMMEVIEKIVPRHPDFCVLCGDDALTLPLMALGGDGVISVVSNSAPAEIAALVRFCLDKDFDAARKMHYRLLPFMRAAFIETNPAPIKFALAQKGLIQNNVRLPLVPVLPQSEKAIKDALEKSGL
ncbi:MAG: 4-hydroxy-tetrahydrodipicolinate synthase [Treponemataceae bacterium]|nr:MAG: 4-hydroxy-tetrahydrodipicolinate synthase [Treponemataceae bacterium]